MAPNHDLHRPGRASKKGVGLVAPLLLLIATAAFRCPGPDPQADPGSGGGGGTTTGQGAGEVGGGPATTSTGGGPTTTSTGGCGNTDLDPMNCGECGRACLVDSAVGVPVCTMGECSSFCVSGFVNLNRPAAPAPDDGCEAQGRRVFVTSTTYFGDFGATDGFPGGAADADLACMDLAMMNGLGGFWRAWVSDPSSYPDNWAVSKPIEPYVLMNGTEVAANWADLTDGVLSNPIDHDELGLPAPTSAWEVWTSTTSGGFFLDWGNCLGWSSNIIQDVGYGGLTNLVNTGWTDGLGQTCDRDIHFYCFEQ